MRKVSKALGKFAEHDIQADCVKLLDCYGVIHIHTDVMCALAYLGSNQGRRMGFIANQKKMGYTVGQSDLILLLRNGKFVCVEMKTPVGSLRPEQKLFKEAVEKKDGEYVVWRSVADCEQWLSENRYRL